MQKAIPSVSCIAGVRASYSRPSESVSCVRPDCRSASGTDSISAAPMLRSKPSEEQNCTKSSNVVSSSLYAFDTKHDRAVQ